ncbi:MAG: hypothetical protein GYB68_12730 [Chloroflexi bacterium]|nr:hypothetical protein [Chloroflexota bacterium]
MPHEPEWEDAVPAEPPLHGVQDAPDNVSAPPPTGWLVMRWLEAIGTFILVWVLITIFNVGVTILLPDFPLIRTLIVGVVGAAFVLAALIPLNRALTLTLGAIVSRRQARERQETE